MNEQSTQPPPPPAIDEVLREESSQSGKPSTSGRSSALDTPEANVIAGRIRPTVLVLAGGVGSGKTSVYAAIYERLGRGPFGGWTFSGSTTIPGFESRCFHWRVNSGRSSPYMPHTSADALPWLHLSLRDVGDERLRLNLLLGDFDGELFEKVLDGRTPSTELPFLFRADHVGLVVDGDRFADPITRAAEVQRATDLISGLALPGGLADTTVLSVVLTKLDILHNLAASDRADAETKLEGLTNTISRIAGVDVPLLRLAVRSKTSAFPIGHGLEMFLERLAVRPAIQVGQRAPIYVPRMSFR